MDCLWQSGCRCIGFLRCSYLTFLYSGIRSSKGVSNMLYIEKKCLIKSCHCGVDVTVWRTQWRVIASFYNKNIRYSLKLHRITPGIRDSAVRVIFLAIFGYAVHLVDCLSIRMTFLTYSRCRYLWYLITATQVQDYHKQDDFHRVETLSLLQLSDYWRLYQELQYRPALNAVVPPV